MEECHDRGHLSRPPEAQVHIRGGLRDHQVPLGVRVVAVAVVDHMEAEAWAVVDHMVAVVDSSKMGAQNSIQGTERQHHRKSGV